MSPPFLGCFDPILFILAGNEDMHKISVEFEFRQDRTTDYELAIPEIQRLNVPPYLVCMIEAMLIVTYMLITLTRYINTVPVIRMLNKRYAVRFIILL